MFILGKHEIKLFDDLIDPIRKNADFYDSPYPPGSRWRGESDRIDFLKICPVENVHSW